MAELGSCVGLSSVPTWMCRSRICALDITGRKKISSLCPDPGGTNAERNLQLWEDLFSDSFQWWDNRLNKAGNSQNLYHCGKMLLETMLVDLSGPVYDGKFSFLAEKLPAS